MDLGLIDVFN